MFNKIKSLFSNKKWSLYLYYNGILIKKQKIHDMSDITTMSINIYFHKELFNRRKINAVIKPVKLLLTDEKKKITYWGVVFEKGVDM